MKYELKTEPYERESEGVETVMVFDAINTNEAKMKMASLFYGYNSVEEMYREFDLKPEDSKSDFLNYVMGYVDALNGDSELDYFISLTDEVGNIVWKAKNPPVEDDMFD